MDDKSAYVGDENEKQADVEENKKMVEPDLEAESNIGDGGLFGEVSFHVFGWYWPYFGSIWLFLRVLRVWVDGVVDY